MSTRVMDAASGWSRGKNDWRLASRPLIMLPMTKDMPLACRYVRVRGVATSVSPESSNHVVCYCDDCQAFARFLATPGTMDVHGSTDIFQVPPAKFQITQGLDAIECMRLTDKGMVRWYAGCCRTPIGNTVSARVPFIGHPFVPSPVG